MPCKCVQISKVPLTGKLGAFQYRFQCTTSDGRTKKATLVASNDERAKTTSRNQVRSGHIKRVVASLSKQTVHVICRLQGRQAVGRELCPGRRLPRLAVSTKPRDPWRAVAFVLEPVLETLLTQTIDHGFVGGTRSTELPPALRRLAPPSHDRELDDPIRRPVQVPCRSSKTSYHRRRGVMPATKKGGLFQDRLNDSSNNSESLRLLRRSGLVFLFFGGKRLEQILPFKPTVLPVDVPLHPAELRHHFPLTDCAFPECRESFPG